MFINLIADNSVASAAAGFAAAIRAAADILQNAVIGNFTLNIRYGWGSYNNVTDPTLTGSGGAYEGGTGADSIDYATTKSWLTAAATSADDASSVNSLNSTTTPNVLVCTAQEKALGHFTGNAADIDGSVAFGTGISPSSWTAVALHEITHAMGRSTSYYFDGVTPTILDLFRYDSLGHNQLTGGAAAYFSANGGATDLANYSQSSDYGDLVNDSVASNDPYDAFYNSNTSSSLTALDLRMLDVMGYNVGAPVLNHAPVVTAADQSVARNVTLAASSLFSVTDADGDAITKYQLWDSTADPASGHFLVGGVAQATKVAIDVSAAQLSSTTFQTGTVSDDLWARAYDGTAWGDWKEFHLNPPVSQAPSATNAAASLFSLTDIMTHHQVLDSSVASVSGHFASSDIAQGANLLAHGYDSALGGWKEFIVKPV